MIVWLPPLALYAAAVQVAWALPFSVFAPQPMIVTPPSLKLTVPVGVPNTPDVTVAVYVTDWPVTDGFADDVTVVVVVATVTLPVKPLCFVQEWNLAVILYLNVPEPGESVHWNCSGGPPDPLPALNVAPLHAARMKVPLPS